MSLEFKKMWEYKKLNFINLKNNKQTIFYRKINNNPKILHNNKFKKKMIKINIHYLICSKMEDTLFYRTFLE